MRTHEPNARLGAAAERGDVNSLLAQLRRLQFVDLTYPLREDMPFYPGRGGLPFEHRWTSQIEVNGLNAARFSMAEHQGTHVDAPVHFIHGGMGIDEIEPAKLLAPAVVIDVVTAASTDDDYCLQPTDITRWEDGHGKIPAGSWVLIRSDWSTRWAGAVRYLNQDADGIMHYPAISPAAAEVLVDRGAAGVGLDTLSPDNSVHTEVRSPAHKILLGHGCLIVENLAQLSRLPPAGVMLFIGVLPIAGGSGAPARILAMFDG